MAKVVSTTTTTTTKSKDVANRLVDILKVHPLLAEDMVVVVVVVVVHVCIFIDRRLISVARWLCTTAFGEDQPNALRLLELTHMHSVTMRKSLSCTMKH